MKAMERILKHHIIGCMHYRKGRSVDAKTFILDMVHRHLEIPNSSARLLFVDFSSAFNTLQPHILAGKLASLFHLDDQMILWILDFLTNRSQRVLVNNTLSDLLYTSTGTPQGCVLSPLLFILYTDDCRSIQPDSYMVKYADDTVLLSLHHGQVLQELVDWCDTACLELIVTKTKEMVVSFSNKQRALVTAASTIIHGQPVELVEEYKYLGTTFDHLLKFASNTEDILRKCQQRLYLLRKLNSFGVRKDILLTFYYSFIESIITFSIPCWFYSVSLQYRNRLQSTVKVCSRIIGLPLRNFTSQ
uniref:Reverse transcriptase domain-containing protein n=1 Tax=Nothobranchius kadleci TaxID=1051664 RepID=A0A1A8BSL2_NOTKA